MPRYLYLVLAYFLHFDYKNVIKIIQQYYPFFAFLSKLFFPGQTPVPPRSGTWILDLAHDPIWAIWLAEVSKFQQRYDRIVLQHFLQIFYCPSPPGNSGGSLIVCKTLRFLQNVYVLMILKLHTLFPKIDAKSSVFWRTLGVNWFRRGLLYPLHSPSDIASVVHRPLVIRNTF